MNTSARRVAPTGRVCRPIVRGLRGVVCAGNYLAAQVGMRLLQQGFTAFDAAAGCGMALNLLECHQNGFGGEAPTLVYSQRDRQVRAISGHGTAPAAATIERFRQMDIEVIPGDGFLPAIVPSALGTWVTLLKDFGKATFAAAAAPVIELAGEGWPLHEALQGAIASNERRFREEWPSSAEVYLPDGRLPQVGEVFRNEQVAHTLERLAQTETAHSAEGRQAALQAVLDELYRGSVAEDMVAFASHNAFRDASGRAHSSLLTLEDFAAYNPRVEEPLSVNYRGLDVYKTNGWTQGPVLLQALNLLEGFDLADMGYNSAESIHTITECIKLAFADREFYYGDPLFVEIPWGMLLAKDYAAQRRKLVDSAAASLKLRPGGGLPEIETFPDVRSIAPPSHDTTKLEVIDRWGNVVSSTPSGGWIPSSPVIPGIGFPLGTRGQMFVLDPEHPNCLAPGKRPRSTLTPTIACRDGEPVLSFGSPGGDNQDQWALQFLVYHLDLGMNLQEAVEATNFSTEHAPSSFYPRRAEPGSLTVAEGVPAAVREELEKRGHRLKVVPARPLGNTMAASRDPRSGALAGAVSPSQNQYYAIAW